MASSPKKRFFRVQIFCEINSEYFRRIKLGARHYAFQTGRMEIVESWFGDDIHTLNSGALSYPVPAGENGELLRNLKKEFRRNRIDGIIAQIRGREAADALREIALPVVDIGNMLPESPFPVVTQDYHTAGRQAAGHLMDSGCASFAFWGHKEAPYSLMLKDGFRAGVAEQLPEARVFEEEGESILVESGSSLIRRMEKWLKQLPIPLGILAAADIFALHLMQAAQNIGLRIPEDIAILGGGDDPYWTDFGNIPLSSIRYNANEIGTEAAALIDKMITQGLRDAPNYHVSGSEVFARRSTDVIFIEDQAISKAVAYIRANAGKNIYVADVAKAAGISLSGLYPRFQKALGHSVLQEICNTRIRHVQMLLRTSSLQLAEIAEVCDFHDTSAMHKLFQRITGKTPAKYRALFRHF